MIDSIIRSIDPKILWQDGRKCQRDPWVDVSYRTPDGVEGRFVYDSSDDNLWFTLSERNGCISPYFAQHMNALLPHGTVLVVRDKHRGWNTADFTVGVDERLQWRY